MKSIRAKILLRTLMIVVLALSLVTAVFAVLNIRSVESTMETVLTELAKSSALAVQNTVDASKNVMRELGINQTFTRSGVQTSEREALISSTCSQYGYTKIASAGIDGITYNQQGSSMTYTKQDVSGEEFFQRALMGEVFMSAPIVSEDGASSKIMVSAPLWKNGRRDTEIAGVVYGELDGSILSDITNPIRIGETGYVYMLDGTGTTIAVDDYSLVLAQENTIRDIALYPELADMAELESKGISGEVGFGTASYDGVPYFLVTAPVGGTENWALGVMVEYGEIMAQPFRALYICIAVSVAALIGAVVVMYGFAGRLTKPITQMEQAIDRVAQGDYNVQIDYRSGDEIGSMAESLRNMVKTNSAIIEDTVRALNEMAQGNFNLAPTVEFVGIFKEVETNITKMLFSLSDTLGQIQTAADQVAGGANQVSLGAQSLSQGAAEQAASVQQLSASLGEVSEQLKHTAHNTAEANRLSAEAESGVERSNASMGRLTGAMADISARSGEIGKIIKTIEDIAFQTNILALNAAVEAARAGEAGKGFAVVADEVRNLAQKSAQAAKNTTELIEGTRQSVDNGSEIAAQTAALLAQVVEKFVAVHENINIIAGAAAQQTEAISQITAGVGQISSVVQTNSATAEESAAASEELSGQSKLLDELLSHFSLMNKRAGEVNAAADELYIAEEA